jgi:mannitol/fructose-specific phosphotransferase system IIA component (Ntr-type)
MKLSEFINFDAIVPQLQSDTRDGAIRELVSALAGTGAFPKKEIEAITANIVERENQGSTGIGKGIAVPHIKHPRVKSIVGTIGCCAEGLDFSSLDKAPVYSVLLLVSPKDDPEKHLEAMERVFSHLQKEMFRKFLRQAENREAIVELIQEADEAQHDSHI